MELLCDGVDGSVRVFRRSWEDDTLWAEKEPEESRRSVVVADEYNWVGLAEKEKEIYREFSEGGCCVQESSVGEHVDDGEWMPVLGGDFHHPQAEPVVDLVVPRCHVELQACAFHHVTHTHRNSQPTSGTDTRGTETQTETPHIRDARAQIETQTQ